MFLINLRTFYHKIIDIFNTYNIDEGNVYSGFGIYNRPLLITYSRSGTNWIRYFIEMISNRPTPGEKRLVGGVNYIIDRAHAGFYTIMNYKKAVLVLRDYRECLIRHHGYNVIKNFDSISEFLTNEDLVQPPSWYIKNIESFEKFEGKKLLIYYEDLIQNPENEFLRLVHFLKLSISQTKSFISDIEKHKEKSIHLYTKISHKSLTKGKPSDSHYHANKHLTFDEKQEFDSFYQNYYPKLFDKYLSRYKSITD